MIAVRVGLGRAYDNQTAQTAIQPTMAFFPHSSQAAGLSYDRSVEETTARPQAQPGPEIEIIEDSEGESGQVV